MSKRKFTEPVDTYTVLVLRLDEYNGSSRSLPDGFGFLPTEKRRIIRAQEKTLLQQLFDDWEIPFEGKLRGLREDSFLFVVHGDELAGGVYLCDQNEFDDDPTRGQLHYVFTNLKFRELGIYSAMVHKAILRAREWGLREIVFNTDRFMLPQVHMRWGFRIIQVIPRPSRIPKGARLLLQPFISLLRQAKRWRKF